MTLERKMDDFPSGTLRGEQKGERVQGRQHFSRCSVTIRSDDVLQGQTQSLRGVLRGQGLTTKFTHYDRHCSSRPESAGEAEKSHAGQRGFHPVHPELPNEHQPEGTSVNCSRRISRPDANALGATHTKSAGRADHFLSRR